MRITTPEANAQVNLDEIDLADTRLYTTGDPHLVWQTLRAERPVFWQTQAAGEGFWAVTRRTDVLRVLAGYQTFTSEAGTAIGMLDAPDPSAGLMMHSTDPPRHRQFRQNLTKPFSSQAALSRACQIRSFAQKAIRPAFDGEILDIAKVFAPLPMHVCATLMGLPEADVDPLLRLSYSSLAPFDPTYNSEPRKINATFGYFGIMEYFSECIKNRRASASDDLISYLQTIKIDGRYMTNNELVLNCLSLLLGAVVTTSHVISSTFIALAELNGEGRWCADLPVRAVVEEALRWSSPVTHFMRRARRDVELHGQLIREGDAITAWIASANRDEDPFVEPYRLDFRRSPNQHIAFGSGPHRCLGAHMARLMLLESFEELIATIESFELASPPRHLVSNEIAGVVSLPLRLKLRNSLKPS